MMKKACTAEMALLKAEAYCSASEHCKDDVYHKLEQWGAPLSSRDTILEHLVEERYIDERRYAVAFVRDKYRFNQWGRIKIAQALRLKHIPSALVSEAMDGIDEDEYLSILTDLLRKKVRGIKAATDYERNGKLIRFAAGHGYDMGEILLCMKRMGCGDESFE